MGKENGRTLIKPNDSINSLNGANLVGMIECTYIEP